jgi:hypothetical protein
LTKGLVKRATGKPTSVVSDYCWRARLRTRGSARSRGSRVVWTHGLNTQRMSAVQKVWSSYVYAIILLQHGPTAPLPEPFCTKMRVCIVTHLQIEGKTVAMSMAGRQAITIKPSRGFKQESVTDDCCVETRKHGEVTSEGQGRKAPREALQWRGNGGCAIVMSKLLDQFRQP